MRLSIAVCGALLSAAVAAQEGAYSAPAHRAYPDELLWGDTHLHTNLSVDANGMGNKLVSPDDAYRFARGERVRAHNGQEVRLSRPLDFLVVADHGINLGVLPRVRRLDPLILKTEIGRKWLRLQRESDWSTGATLNETSLEEWREQSRRIGSGSGDPASFFWAGWGNEFVWDEDFRRSVWSEVCANAERHNEPGRFTAFIGYEYTPPTRHPKSPNFHRIVLFEGGEEEACQVLPFTYKHSENVEDLWGYLADYEQDVGGKVLAIPHNGNLSSGRMFYPYDIEDEPIDRDYAVTRGRFEPLYEMTQYKGDSEAHPILSPNDEFADFETWDGPGFRNSSKGDDWAEIKRYEYARSALKEGLGQQARLGVNPFKFGMIGSTDAHTGFATADEDNFWGKRSLDEVSPNRLVGSWWYGASGYAAVWAHENTRASIFAAMQRREVYATTGPRIRVRLFAGWNFAEEDALRPDLARIGYRQGVPMGGDLSAAPAGGSPTLLIHAARDPEGANLDRVQVIKGWRDAAGELRERVYDVALSDGRTIPRRGRAKPVGSTVDLATATYRNSIGDPELAVVWRDPDFDPAQLAFYYVRVIQIPTPRWTAYDAAHYGVVDVPDAIPMVVQDRAYTSPVWYTP